MAQPQIPGVSIINLKRNKDFRGSYTEFLREEWFKTPKPLQWSIVHSRKNALRGMRIHLVHYDYTCLSYGKALYVLRDLRGGSPTEGKNQYLELDSNKLRLIVTPPGVAHGFYFLQDSIFVVGITQYYNKKDELGFHYNDPEAGISWPSSNPILSERDKNLPSLQKVSSLVPAWSDRHEKST